MGYNRGNQMAGDVAGEQARFMAKVFGWMFAGLMLTAFVTVAISSIPVLAGLFINKAMFVIMVLVQLGLVVALSFLVKKVSPAVAGLMFFVFCVSVGITFAPLMLLFTTASVGMVFGSTSLLFGGLALVGYTTGRDLTGMGSLCFAGLVMLIVVGIANWFIGSSMLNFALNVVGVLVFVGLTAYDVQKIKKMNVLGNEGTGEDTKEAIYGALTLYLDFINLFIRLLSLFGNRR